MRKKCPPILTLLFLLIVPVPTVFAQESEQPAPQLVVLTNGSIFEGAVTVAEKEIIVATTQGSRIVLAKDRVDFVCNNLEEAYWEKTARTRASDTAGQLRLFNWCVKNELFERAEAQFNLLMETDIEPAQLNFAYRRMNMAREIKKQNVAEAAIAAEKARQIVIDQKYQMRSLPPMNDSPDLDAIRPLKESLADDRNQAGSEQGPIRQVGFNAPLTPGKATEPVAPPKRKKASIRDLEELTKSLPKPAIAMFKRKLEPLIARSCYASGCHNTEATTMPLMRLGRSQVIPRRLSQRNLHSIIQFTDPNEPLKSKLLTFATTAHGGAKLPTIEVGSKQFNNLATWLVMISNRPDEQHFYNPTGFQHVQPSPELPGVTAPANLAGPEPQSAGHDLSIDESMLELPDFVKNENSSLDNQPSSETNPQKAPVPLPPELILDGTELLVTPKKTEAHGAKTSEKKNADPFDPSEFNKGG